MAEQLSLCGEPNTKPHTLGRFQAVHEQGFLPGVCVRLSNSAVFKGPENACLNTSIHPYIPTYIPSYMHTCIRTSAHPYMHACMHAYLHAYMLFRIHAYIHTCMHACMHAVMSVCTALAWPSYRATESSQNGTQGLGRSGQSFFGRSRACWPAVQGFQASF